MNIVNEFFTTQMNHGDYVQDGTLHMGANVPSVMVGSEADLASLPDVYPPSTIAYTAGFKAMFQLDAGGNWVSML